MITRNIFFFSKKIHVNLQLHIFELRKNPDRYSVIEYRSSMLRNFLVHGKGKFFHENNFENADINLVTSNEATKECAIFLKPSLNQGLKNIEGSRPCWFLLYCLRFPVKKCLVPQGPCISRPSDIRYFFEIWQFRMGERAIVGPKTPWRYGIGCTESFHWGSGWRSSIRTSNHWSRYKLK